MYFNDTLPDVVQDCQYGAEVTTSVLFLDHHFTLQWQEEYSERYDDLYHHYLQGYIAFSNEGFDLAEFYFARIAAAIHDDTADISSLFDSEFHAWVAPSNESALQHGMVHFDTNSDVCLWERFTSHDLFNMGFKFRCLVNSSFRHVGETRFPDYFLTLYLKFQHAHRCSRQYLILDPWFSIRPRGKHFVLRRWERKLIIWDQWNDIRALIIGRNIKTSDPL